MSQGNATESQYVEPNPVLRAIKLRWKHAVAVTVLGAATYGLYGIAQSWTIDSAVFGLVTLGIIVYGAATLPSDMK
ncbi:hypothetical protein DM867_12995 [Halosegnis rubeus]|jgi:hypothetical protein|uniref:Uncharacterized protein n=1 Tax=Halosegnis rubeus TaxID=2212850 RepID=A0A5N5U1U0_9EURY|nr:hypothetical protein [Halosegnis rubeus]KAB7512500.1 hypothetical protein DM867_12995 [Halosegnis rubeus]KAB7512594.1 hypothetical protein DMP03_14010 [Halosegnis rubeus]KAB7514072.1 hypothetical protein DP108_12235 [Halosegnis rubeus]